MTTPKRTTLRRNTWTPEERQEYDEVMAKVIAHSKNTAARLDLFEQLLADAIQARRIWARDVERSLLRDGLASEIRRYLHREQALVSYRGEVLNMPRIQGVKTRTTSGVVVHQQAMIELCPWDQIIEKRKEALKAVGTYTAKIAHYDKLLALHDLAPDAETPMEAAMALGTTVDKWLVGGRKRKLAA